MTALCCSHQHRNTFGESLIAAVDACQIIQALKRTDDLGYVTIPGGLEQRMLSDYVKVVRVIPSVQHELAHHVVRAA
eukprot:CAMPEP_0172900582 /NCGR_PEP_ID=MMETSP1075-20121228/164421_1 /TAXON_ID=2916 /ORGANISM="Ceratium fusus, Strain PA161109" /LENGTH=76 /DNA_ID=CAMNT_0013756799 /DNA_START=139 /DNA_END=369 /DNA_ORIENTATION=+